MCCVSCEPLSQMNIFKVSKQNKSSYLLLSTNGCCNLPKLNTYQWLGLSCGILTNSEHLLKHFTVEKLCQVTCGKYLKIIYSASETSRIFTDSTKEVLLSREIITYLYQMFILFGPIHAKVLPLLNFLL